MEFICGLIGAVYAIVVCAIAVAGNPRPIVEHLRPRKLPAPEPQRWHHTPPRPLPTSLSVRPIRLLSSLNNAVRRPAVQTGDVPFDGSYEITRGNPELVEALLTPEITGLLRELMGGRGAVDVRPTSIELVQPPGAVLPRAQSMLARLSELLDAENRHWRQAAEAHNLQLIAHLPHAHLAGRGLSVHLLEDPLRTTIVATLGLPFPLTVAHRKSSDAPGIGNPILDMLLSVESPCMPKARALLDDERLTESLLAVLHRWPDSTLTETRLVLVAPGRLTDGLAEALDEVQALRQMLET